MLGKRAVHKQAGQEGCTQTKSDARAPPQFQTSNRSQSDRNRDTLLRFPIPDSRFPIPDSESRFPIPESRIPKEGLINSPQMRDTTASCRGFIHAT
ncbi:hypothetical protein KWH03_18415, partial [Xanthomonas campestris pv. lawsoniae]|nr:hypothetical protein [Xanthomonas campestris pv. lawsoniae]